MGKFYYGAKGTQVTFDDRLLAHLKVVIVAKLRRDEKFILSWQRDADAGGGRCTVWLHPAIELQFEFDETERPSLNRYWVDALMNTANSGDGLRIIPEPEAAPPLR